MYIICCPNCGRDEAYEEDDNHYYCPLCDFEWEYGTDEDGFQIIVWDNKNDY
ncbi:MAG: hypothetical protein IKQ46_02735 [Bacteroidales bacterium]|nr:hypothetical protein [Bacteroidales bacterium]